MSAYVRLDCFNCHPGPFTKKIDSERSVCPCDITTDTIYPLKQVEKRELGWWLNHDTLEMLNTVNCDRRINAQYSYLRTYLPQTNLCCQ